VYVCVWWVCVTLCRDKWCKCLALPQHSTRLMDDA